MSEPSNFEQKLAQVVETYQQQIIDILRGASVAELVEVAKKGAIGPAVVEEAAAQAEAEEDDQEQVQGDEIVADEVAATAEPAVKPEAGTAKKPRKKRSWPTCSAPGCTRNMYGPSGKAKLCYQHHREAGGQPAPFAKKKAAADKSTATAATAESATDKAAKAEAPAASPSQPAMRLEQQPPSPKPSSSKPSRRRKQAEVAPSVIVRKRNGDKGDGAGERVSKTDGTNGKPADEKDAKAKAEALFEGLS